MDALAKNRAELAAMATHANPRPSSPVTSGRADVRGFLRSKSRSAIRLKIMAALRAPTMAPRIQPI